jgi:TRAP-type transport system periplasmic protein
MLKKGESKMIKNYIDGRHMVCIILVFLFMVFTITPAVAAGPVLLRFAASDPEGSTAPAKSIGKLCELITKLSNGELQAQPFYQSLGIEQQIATAVKSGSVDGGFTTTANLTPFTDAFLMYDFPFLFKNDRGAIDCLENHPAGKKTIAQMEQDLGVKVLLITSHTYDSPTSGKDLITRNTQVRVPNDIKGLKLRTSSATAEIFLLRAYGANPTPVPYAQVYAALQQGVVDGNACTPVPAAAAIKLYEVTKYYTALCFGITVLPIYMNQKKFDSLTPFQKKVILDAAEQVKPLAGQWAREKTVAAISEFEKAGVHIYYPNKEEMEKWLAVRQDVWKQIAEVFKGKIDLNIANALYTPR